MYRRLKQNLDGREEAWDGGSSALDTTQQSLYMPL